MMNEMRPETAAAMRKILDTFSGSDGGVSFIKLSAMVLDLDAQAAKGDAAAEKVLKHALGLARLIDIANREP